MLTSTLLSSHCPVASALPEPKEETARTAVKEAQDSAPILRPICYEGLSGILVPTFLSFRKRYPGVRATVAAVASFFI